MLTIEVVSSRDDIREFVDLPPRIYAGLKGFESPLLADRNMLLNPAQSTFWKRACVCYWLARIEGKAVGRISAQVDSSVPVGIDKGAGMFGCLDAVDDRDVISALIGFAEQWLFAQNCTSMFGPCTLDMNSEPGLLIEGADEPPITLCPWHPPYLRDHMEELGFRKLRDLHNWRLDLVRAPPSSADGRLRLADRLPNLRIRHPTRSSYAHDIQLLCNIYNDGWQDNWGFVPLTPADLAGLDQLMKWFVPREAFKIVELAGKPVAVMLLIPNLYELTHGLGPKPGITGWILLLWRVMTHRFRSGKIIVFGIVRDLQRTMLGSAVAALLIDELIAGQAVLKGEWVEAGWVLENNSALIQILHRFKFQRNRTFRVYGRSIAVV
jgi:hypothetical protein